MTISSMSESGVNSDLNIGLASQPRSPGGGSPVTVPPGPSIKHYCWQLKCNSMAQSLALALGRQSQTEIDCIGGSDLLFHLSLPFE